MGLYYPGGPHKRPLLLWEELADEGITIPQNPPKANHYVTWKIYTDTSESGNLIAIDASTNAPESFLSKGVKRSPFWHSMSQNPADVFRKFYNWLLILQEKQATWWRQKARDIKLQISTHPYRAKELNDKLTAYGEQLPCLGFNCRSFDLKATSEFWCEVTQAGGAFKL